MGRRAGASAARGGRAAAGVTAGAAAPAGAGGLDCGPQASCGGLRVELPADPSGVLGWGLATVAGCGRRAGRSPNCSGIAHGFASFATGASGGGRFEPPSSAFQRVFMARAFWHARAPERCDSLTRVTVSRTPSSWSLRCASATALLLVLPAAAVAVVVTPLGGAGGAGLWRTLRSAARRRRRT